MEWNVDTIGDLHNKIIIVTGGNSGLGFEAAKVFAQHHATVILACRSLQRAMDAKNEIRKETNSGIIDMLELDLASLSSIKDFVTQFKQKYKTCLLYTSEAETVRVGPSGISMT